MDFYLKNWDTVYDDYDDYDDAANDDVRYKLFILLPTMKWNIDLATAEWIPDGWLESYFQFSLHVSKHFIWFSNSFTTQLLASFR